MVRMMVTCGGDATTRFDRDYYATKHLALALEAWGPHGLLAVAAFFPPASEGNGILSIGVYDFRDGQAMDAALASPETGKVMADVGNFTDALAIERSVWRPLDA